MVARVSQLLVASLSASNLAYTNASQIGVAALAAGLGDVRGSQFGTVALSGGLGGLRSSQFAPAALSGGLGSVRAAQTVVEILVWNYTPPMPSLFPALPGLTYSVIKRPKFFTGIGTSATGREVRVAYAEFPLWEFELTYNWLPDKAAGSALTPSDLKMLMGFWLAQSGAFHGFMFEDPDDHGVTGQVLGVTDGTTTTWLFERSYGGAGGVGTEPIGWLNISITPVIYLNGVAVDPSLYALLTTHGCQQQLRFGTAPTTGKNLTADFSYYYSVRFAEDHQDFEKFMDRLWSTAKLTLMSQRD